MELDPVKKIMKRVLRNNYNLPELVSCKRFEKKHRSDTNLADKIMEFVLTAKIALFIFAF